MTAPNIIPFTRATVRSGPDTSGAAEKGAGHGQFAGAHPFPADLEPLAASIFADLATDSVFGGLTALIDRALSERVEHRVKPLAAIADAAVDPLMDLRESLTEVMTRLARSQAIAEARDLDAAFADMPQDDQAVELGWLRADQRKALLWAQSEAMAAATGGAA